MFAAGRPVIRIAISAGALAIVLVLALLTYTRSTRFAAKTYDMAVAADDAGQEAVAKRLFAEACSEGSAQACEQSAPKASSSKVGR